MGGMGKRVVVELDEFVVVNVVEDVGFDREGRGMRVVKC